MQAKDDGGIQEALNGIRCSTVQGLVRLSRFPCLCLPFRLGGLFLSDNDYVGCRRDRHKDIS